MSLLQSKIRDITFLHMTGASKVFPTLADGATITGAAGAWAKGAWAAVMAKGSSPQTGSWVVPEINIEALSAADFYEIDLGYGEAGFEIVFASLRVTAVGRFRISSPIFSEPLLISARLASASGGADTAVISIGYHTDPLL